MWLQQKGATKNARSVFFPGFFSTAFCCDQFHFQGRAYLSHKRFPSHLFRFSNVPPGICWCLWGLYVILCWEDNCYIFSLINPQKCCGKMHRRDNGYWPGRSAKLRAVSTHFPGNPRHRCPTEAWIPSKPQYRIFVKDQFDCSNVQSLKKAL